MLHLGFIQTSPGTETISLAAFCGKIDLQKLVRKIGLSGSNIDLYWLEEKSYLVPGSKRDLSGSKKGPACLEKYTSVVRKIVLPGSASLLHLPAGPPPYPQPYLHFHGLFVVLSIPYFVKWFFFRGAFRRICRKWYVNENVGRGHNEVTQKITCLKQKVFFLSIDSSQRCFTYELKWGLEPPPPPRHFSKEGNFCLYNWEQKPSATALTNAGRSSSYHGLIIAKG